MVKSVLFSPDQPFRYDLTPESMVQALAIPGNLLWVVLVQPDSKEIDDILRQVFNFHPLAIEDCQNTGYQTPKVDDFEKYLFIITHALIQDEESIDKLDILEFDLFLGPNYVVCSYHTNVLPVVDSLWARLEKDSRLMTHGADVLCHAILDALVDDYLPMIDRIDEEIEWLEDRVLEKPNADTLQRILALKHVTLTLRKTISPQREIMNQLSRDEYNLIQPSHRIYFRDIYDHLVRIQDLIDSVRDIASGTLDIYLSATSNRLNEVMKALTIVSTIFLPLSFIAGVYGMNFKYFPEINWRFGYLYVWILFLATAGGMVWYFKKKKWI